MISSLITFARSKKSADSSVVTWLVSLPPCAFFMGMVDISHG
jgi:hypothetical protein